MFWFEKPVLDPADVRHFIWGEKQVEILNDGLAENSPYVGVILTNIPRLRLLAISIESASVAMRVTSR
jgi:hypothetical protein